MYFFNTSYPELAQFPIHERRHIALAAIQKHGRRSTIRTIVTFIVLLTAFAYCIRLPPPSGLSYWLYWTGLGVILIILLMAQVLIELNGPYRTAVCRFLTDSEKSGSDPLEVALGLPPLVEIELLQRLLSNSKWRPEAMLRSRRKFGQLAVIGLVLSMAALVKVLSGRLIHPAWLLLTLFSGALCAYSLAHWLGLGTMPSWRRYLDREAMSNRLDELRASSPTVKP